MMKAGLVRSSWFLAIALTLPLSVASAAAAYRGLTDEHMSGYIGGNRVVTIENGIGGHVQGMIAMLVKIIDRDRRVVIDGPCRSACTLLTSLGTSRVCVTPRAELWFHQASLLSGKRSKFWSNAMLKLYPPRIRSYVSGRGGLSRKWIVLKGRSLARAFPSPCGGRAKKKQREARTPVPVIPVRDRFFARQGR